MKIVVTGALGHIGSRLLRQLPAQFREAEWVLIDDLSTQRYCSLFALPEGHKFRFIESDVVTMELEPVLKGAHALIHLAAITNAAESFDQAKRVETVNFTATERIAKVCADLGVRLFFPSTTSVYGTQESVVDESCGPAELKPQSPYAQSKLDSEEVLAKIGKARGLKYVSCRFGTIFGTSPGMRFHTAINKFCWQASLGLPITVWRTALHQARPYLDLTDAVEAVGHVLKRDLFDREIYNVVTVNSTVQDIVHLIAEHRPDLKIEYVDTRIMNQLSYVVKSEKFANQGFVCTGDLGEGIRETMQFLRGVRV
jgi:UDP-glucose 4-epimerase